MSKYRKKLSSYEQNEQLSVVLQLNVDVQEQQNISHNNNSVQPLKTNSTKQKKTYENIQQIPEVKLSLEDMNKDPTVLIAQFQNKFQKYGAIKLKACTEWNPPFSFKYSEKSIKTRIQKIHKLKQGKAFQEKEYEYTINSFTSFAKNFQKEYKFKYPRVGLNKQAQIQYEYWNIVNGKVLQGKQKSEKVKLNIQYAADMPAHLYGSGFPTYSNSKTLDENFQYSKSFFNLNNIFKAPGSALKISQNIKQNISGITIPWVYIGMLFSSFCWHVQDLWLNSINYNHQGATKTWYIIPASDKDKFDAYIMKRYENRQFLNSITFMVDPLELLQNGIQVYKAYQRPHQYILTLFNAYHAGFSQGYNVGEAVNVVNLSSFALIKKALERNKTEKGAKPPVFSYQWLVYKNLGNECIDQKLIKEQYTMLSQRELDLVKKVIVRHQIKGIEWMDPAQKYDKTACSACKCYQYLSLLKCQDCSKKFCLQHPSKCCGKPLIFLSRPVDSYRELAIQFVSEHTT